MLCFINISNINHIIYRKSNKNEAYQLAVQKKIANGGIIEFLLHDLIPGMTVTQILSEIVANEAFNYSYKNCIVAERNGQVVGHANFYPSDTSHSQSEPEIIPQNRLDYLAEMFSAEVPGSLYLNSIAVFPEARRNKIGSELLSIVKVQAKKQNLNQVSLLVWADNFIARKFYENHGFKIIRRIQIKPHEFLPHQDGMLLMNCVMD